MRGRLKAWETLRHMAMTRERLGPAAEGFLGLAGSGQASVSTGLMAEARVGRKGEAGGPENPWGQADMCPSMSTAVE